MGNWTGGSDLSYKDIYFGRTLKMARNQRLSKKPDFPRKTGSQKLKDIYFGRTTQMKEPPLWAALSFGKNERIRTGAGVNGARGRSRAATRPPPLRRSNPFPTANGKACIFNRYRLFSYLRYWRFPLILPYQPQFCAFSSCVMPRMCFSIQDVICGPCVIVLFHTWRSIEKPLLIPTLMKRKIHEIRLHLPINPIE